MKEKEIKKKRIEIWKKEITKESIGDWLGYLNRVGYINAPTKEEFELFLAQEKQKAIEEYAKEVIPFKDKKWREIIKKEKQKWVGEIKLEKKFGKFPIRKENDALELHEVIGYNQAIKDLEALKQKLKKVGQK